MLIPCCKWCRLSRDGQSSSWCWLGGFWDVLLVLWAPAPPIPAASDHWQQFPAPCKSQFPGNELHVVFTEANGNISFADWIWAQVQNKFWLFSPFSSLVYSSETQIISFQSRAVAMASTPPSHVYTLIHDGNYYKKEFEVAPHWFLVCMLQINGLSTHSL